MERVIFCFLLFRGLCGSSVPRQYIFINQPKEWSEAQRYCREKYIDLATVSDLADLEKIADLATPFASHVFLGLHREWRWSLSNGENSREGELTYNSWSNGGFGDCAMMANGSWTANPCSMVLNFICYNRSTTELTDRFVKFDAIGDWHTARDYCKSKHMTLARVRSQMENDELKRIAGANLAWIGLTKEWLWSDRSEASFIPWKAGEPGSFFTEDCGAVAVGTNAFGLLDKSCSESMPFACYIGGSVKHVIRLKFIPGDLSLDMKDSAVLDSILRQVEKKLQDGVSKGIKLSWKKPPEKEKKPETL